MLQCIFKGIFDLKENEFTTHLSCLILIIVQLFGTFMENILKENWKSKERAFKVYTEWSNKYT